MEIDVERARSPSGVRVDVVDPAGRRVFGFLLTYEGSTESTDAEGHPIRLSLSGLAPTAISIPPLGEDGVPTVGFLPLLPGSYVLRVVGPERSSATRKVTVVEGKAVDVRFVLEPAAR